MSTFSTVCLIAIFAGLLVYVLKGPRATGVVTSYERVGAITMLILYLLLFVYMLFS